MNGAIAFGAAIAGGPIGAFMALPVAALLTSFFRTYAHAYPLAYRSAYDREHEAAAVTGTPDLATG